MGVVNGLSPSFKDSLVSTATGVGALPSRDTVRFTTAAWASGKKSKRPPGVPPGVGAGGMRAAIGDRAGTGLCAPQAAGCGW